MNWRTYDLRPNPRSLSIYGETSVDAGLLHSIQQSGFREPLVVKPDGTIISGHRRWAAAKELGLDTVPAQVVTFSSDLEELQAILDFNRHRHKTFSQKMREAEALEEIERERAKARQGTRTDLGPNIRHICDGCSSGRVDDIVAAAVGLGSRQTLRRAKEVWSAAKSGNPKAIALVQELDDDKTNVSRALRHLHLDVRLEATRQKISTTEGIQIEEPTGEYDVLIIDPPWPMQAPQSPGFDYPTMTEDELAALKIPAAPDCHLWLWTTQAFLPMALRLLEAWGFTYKTTFVWRKPAGMQPPGLPQYNCEFVLYAQRGHPHLINTVDLPACFEAPRGKHSQKPDKFYDMVRRATTGQRLDMFNRHPIEGFDTWGKEAAPRPPSWPFADDPHYLHYVLPYLAGFSPHACAGNLYLCPNYSFVSPEPIKGSDKPRWLVEREAVLAELGLEPEGTDHLGPDAPRRIGLAGV